LFTSYLQPSFFAPATMMRLSSAMDTSSWWATWTRLSTRSK
jgi:hypothetical protein